MRLIDADALKQYCDDNWIVLNHDAVDKQPTVEAVPVIRCMDCVYKNEYGYCTMYINFHHLTADMDYCSDAERRDDEN